MLTENALVASSDTKTGIATLTFIILTIRCLRCCPADYLEGVRKDAVLGAEFEDLVGDLVIHDSN